MLEEIPSSLLTEWMAFGEIEPISLGWRIDLAAARVTATLANIYRNREEQETPFEIGDFMPEFDRPQKTAEELLMLMRTWIKAHNARQQKVM